MDSKSKAKARQRLCKGSHRVGDLCGVALEAHCRDLCGSSWPWPWAPGVEDFAVTTVWTSELHKPQRAAMVSRQPGSLPSRVPERHLKLMRSSVPWPTQLEQMDTEHLLQASGTHEMYVVSLENQRELLSILLLTRILNHLRPFKSI